MELYKFKVDGIYDLRTLIELKKKGVDHFCFDFNPRSFNFIQERVFLDLLDNALNETDKIFLHFTHNKDFMVYKIYSEILKRRGNLFNIFFEFDEFFSESETLTEMRYLLLYGPSIFSLYNHLDNLAGFIFPHDLLLKINREGNLISFYSNFVTHFKSSDLDSKMFILKIGWDEVINTKCLDVFDFNLINLTLSPEVEVCYRNIDINKLKSKFDSQKNMFRAHCQL